MPIGLLKVGLGSGRHAGFSRSVVPYGWQADSWSAGTEASKTESRVRVRARAYGNGSSDLPALRHTAQGAE